MPSPERRRLRHAPDGLAELAAEMPSVDTLLELLAAANARDRKPIWQRYDHMNGTNTLVGPGAGDAALLRIKGTSRALAVAIDGPGPARVGALDPYLAGASAVVEGALNVACSGATPIGVTDCLNFGSPETELGAWQLERAIDGIAAACRALGLPVVSGNVSLYNETPDGPILPTPVIGTIGMLDDREARVGMGWSRGDEIWLLGDPAADVAALVASELAWRRAVRGGVPVARRGGRRRRRPAAAGARPGGPRPFGARLLGGRDRCRAGAHRDRGRGRGAHRADVGRGRRRTRPPSGSVPAGWWLAWRRSERRSSGERSRRPTFR